MSASLTTFLMRAGEYPTVALESFSRSMSAWRTFFR
jgi:hypothetical protein